MPNHDPNAHQRDCAWPCPGLVNARSFLETHPAVRAGVPAILGPVLRVQLGRALRSHGWRWAGMTEQRPGVPLAPLELERTRMLVSFAHHWDRPDDGPLRPVREQS